MCKLTIKESRAGRIARLTGTLSDSNPALLDHVETWLANLTNTFLAAVKARGLAVKGELIVDSQRRVFPAGAEVTISAYVVKE
jgi:hypothetical protein